jgi:hypothetical protein
MLFLLIIKWFLIVCIFVLSLHKTKKISISIQLLKNKVLRFFALKLGWYLDGFLKTLLFLKLSVINNKLRYRIIKFIYININMLIYKYKNTFPFCGIIV